MTKRTPRSQTLLFESRPKLPIWNALPSGCREEVLQLIVRMLREHARQGDRAMAAVDRNGGGDE